MPGILIVKLGVWYKPRLGLIILWTILILSGCRPPTAWHWERAEAGLPRQTVVLAVAVDPADPDRLWAGHYAPSGLATSQDGGQTWITGVQGLGDNPIFDLLPIPGGPLWAATRDGLMVSTDDGATWEPAAGDLPPTTAFALATDRFGRIYVGLDDAGLHRGETGGENWVPLARDETTLATAAILSLAISPDGGQIYAGTAGRGLFVSSDGGHTWNTAFPGDYVPNLALAPSRPATAVASLRDRLVRTEDGGRSWEILPVSWARNEVVSLLWLADVPSSEAGGGTLWAGSGASQLYCSQDSGDSWQEAVAHPPIQGGLLDLATAGDRLVAGAWTGVYAGPGRCGKDGQDWNYLSPSLGFPHANTLLAAETGLLLGTRAGLFRWVPAERRWVRVRLQHPRGGDAPPGGVTALGVASSDRGVLYAGTAASGLYRSHDGGASWAKVPSDLEVGVRTLAVAPEDADHVYIIAAWERVYESRDGGQSWEARWTGLGTATEAISIAIEPLDHSTVYLGAEASLYRSRYGGEDWRPVGHSLDGQTILALQAGPASALYVGATRGAYRSSDGGHTVEPWGQGLEDISVTAFIFDPDDSRIVYAGTAYAGLYQSLDGGETWQPMAGAPGVADEVVESLAWGPTGELLIATAGGVWMGTNES